MPRYRSIGKEVLRDNVHYADAVDNAAAAIIASAMNEWISNEHVDHVLIGEHLHTPGTHGVRQEGDEYACSCGLRWDVSEGAEHP